jgi:predicted ATPase
MAEQLGHYEILEPDSPIFVARESELGQLNCFLKRALAGQSSVVFVTGEAGAGKTTLIRILAIFVRRYTVRGITLSWTCSHHMSRSILDFKTMMHHSAQTLKEQATLAPV